MELADDMVLHSQSLDVCKESACDDWSAYKDPRCRPMPPASSAMPTRRRTVQVPQVRALVRHEQSDRILCSHSKHSSQSQPSQAVSRGVVEGSSSLSRIRSPRFR